MQNFIILLKKFQLFDVGDRAGLMYDSFMLASSSQLDYDIALNLTRYLTGETHYLPWSVAHQEFSNFHHKLFGTDSHEPFKVISHYVKTRGAGAKTRLRNRFSTILAPKSEPEFRVERRLSVLLRPNKTGFVHSFLNFRGFSEVDFP